MEERNWLEYILLKYNITRYTLYKELGIDQSTTSRIISSNISMENCKYGHVTKILNYTSKLENYKEM